MSNIIVNLAKHITNEEFQELLDGNHEPKRHSGGVLTGYITSWKRKPSDAILAKTYHSRDIDAYGVSFATSWYVNEALVAFT